MFSNIRIILLAFCFLFVADFSFLHCQNTPEGLRAESAKLFDNSGSYIPQFPGVKTYEEEYRFTVEMKYVLSSGKWNGSIPQTRHFIFRNAREGWSAQAQSPGLEGFFWTKKELEGKYGFEAFSHHLKDYFPYLEDLLKEISWTASLRQTLAKLKTENISDKEKNDILNAILDNYIYELQGNMSRYDKADWVRKARIYELFPRAYNLQGRRESGGFKYFSDKKFFSDFKISDFEIIKSMGFDTLWPMGILPIGVKGQTGTGGGSPYSISDHSTVNSELGSEEDFRNFVKKAHDAGLRVIVDFVVNHTSLDAKLLFEDPAYFISYPSLDGKCPANDWFYHYDKGKTFCVHNGGFEYGGGVSTWIDTAQINYANEKLRKRMVEIIKGWTLKFDVDGFRVDMAYLALNNVFSRTWNRTMPQGEFYGDLIREVKKIKPSSAFIAEAYAFQEDLSAFGFDMIYSKFETGRIEGQTGWYNATESGDYHQIASSINRNAFLAWQKGGAGSVVFAGNHDEPAPERIYGKRLPAALALTMFYPGGVLSYNGAEIGYDAHVPNGEHKPLPFSVPCQIDWNSQDAAIKKTYENVFKQSAAIRKDLGDYVIEPLWTNSGISGYIMKSLTKPGLKKAVVANLTEHRGQAFVFGVNYSLDPGEYRIIDIK